MKIYIVLEHWAHEGESIRGVKATKAEADDLANRFRFAYKDSIEVSFSVIEFELGYEDTEALSD